MKDVGQEGARVDRLRKQIELVDLGPRQVQQIVDQTDQVLAAVINVLQILHERFRQLAAVRVGHRERGLAVAHDHVQRGAQLVADVGQQTRLEAIGLLGGRARLQRLVVQLGVAHGDAELVGQRLQADQFLMGMLGRLPAVQVEQAQGCAAQADRHHYPRARVRPERIGRKAVAAPRIRDEDRLVAHERLAQQPSLGQRNPHHTILRTLGLLQDQHLLALRPQEQLDLIVAVAGPNQIGELVRELLAVQQRAGAAVDLEAGLQLGQPALLLLAIDPHQAVGEISDRDQFLHGHLGDVLCRHQSRLVAEVGGQRLPQRRLIRQVDRLVAEVGGRGLDRRCHATLGDRRQGQRIAVDPHDQRVAIDPAQRPASVARGERQRVREAEDRIDRAIELA